MLMVMMVLMMVVAVFQCAQMFVFILQSSSF